MPFQKGNKLSPEHLAKLKSQKISLEMRQRISKTLTGRYRGKDNPHWKGGMLAFKERQAKLYLLKKEEMAGRKRPERCEICDSVSGTGRYGILWDHSHSTGKFRGWICHRCNVIIGFAKDDPLLLISISRYLQK